MLRITKSDITYESASYIGMNMLYQRIMAFHVEKSTRSDDVVEECYFLNQSSLAWIKQLKTTKKTIHKNVFVFDLETISLTTQSNPFTQNRFKKQISIERIKQYSELNIWMNAN